MTRLALFDLDNTLVDRTAAFLEWSHVFCRECALDPGATAWIAEADGDGFTARHELFVRVKHRYGIPDSVDELLDRYYEQYFSCFRPDQSVIAALLRLRESGWRIGVVTNGARWQRTKLERAGLAEIVDALCTSHEIGWPKPDRRIFEEAARRCGAPLRGWMIGDNPEADILGGHQVGLRTVWMARGRQWEEQALRPTGIARTVEEAVSLMVSADLG